MKLSKDMQEIAASLLAEKAADAAAPFRTLAGEIAGIVSGKKAHSKKASEASATLWDKFRTALTIAHDSDLSAQTLKLGLAVACAEAEVPSGSYRSYVKTVADMLAEIRTGNGFTLDEALKLPVVAARERYLPAAEKAIREARARIAELTADWTADQLNALADQLTPAEAEAATADTEVEAQAA